MMEIKFRVWDKINKEYSKLLVFDTESSGVVLSGGKYGRHSALKENVIIEQYIGLPDKNGKEIYKGDIVRKGNTYGVVCFCEKNASYYVKFGRFNFFFGFDVDHSDIDIIGTENEDTELLTNET